MQCLNFSILNDEAKQLMYYCEIEVFKNKLQKLRLLKNIIIKTCSFLGYEKMLEPLARESTLVQIVKGNTTQGIARNLG